MSRVLQVELCLPCSSCRCCCSCRRLAASAAISASEGWEASALSLAARRALSKLACNRAQNLARELRDEKT